MQKRDGTDQVQAEAAWERTRTSYPIDRAIRPSIHTLHQQSIDNNNATSIDKCPILNTTVSEKDKFNNQFLTPDEFGIFMDPDGYAKVIYGLEQVKEQRREIQEVRCRFEGYDAEQPSRTTRRSCKFGTFDPQGNTLLIDRQHHLCVARFCSTTVDPDTSSVDRYSLTTVDRNTHLPSTNILHLTSINTPSQTSIDTEPRDMVAPLILARDNNGDMHDQDGHLRNAEGQRIDAQGAAIPGPHANATEGRADEEEVNYIGGTGFQGSGNQGGNRNSYGKMTNFNQNPHGEGRKSARRRFRGRKLMSFVGSQWCRSTPDLEHRSTGTLEHRSMTPTKSAASCNAVKILTHDEFTTKHPYPPSPGKVRIARRADTSIDQHGESSIDQHSEATIDRQPPVLIDRRAPITYRVQMPNIDVARLNALRPKPIPSEYPPKPVTTPSDDGEDPMEEDMVPTGRTLTRRNEKVVKHLKRGANDKEKESFRKRVFRIPIDKPFEDAYYTHILLLGVDRDSHSNIDQQWSSDIDRQMTGRIGR
ncbi:hypothetical protein F2Q69_00047839 [Brassica cretica]|uniref:Uncharacterized protein n=1 Tax=Brassica cretica TaxID=69181 RepID=A0A8S9PPE5_BRACR|nr:hypothetical protein F2Q69_00047839 [Brassica cretica]